MLCSATAFSLLMEASQPKKQVQKRNLFFGDLSVGGLPVYNVIGLEDIDEYGDPTAENLKIATDNSFDKLQIPREVFFLMKLHILFIVLSLLKKQKCWINPCFEILKR